MQFCKVWKCHLLFVGERGSTPIGKEYRNRNFHSLTFHPWLMMVFGNLAGLRFFFFFFPPIHVSVYDLHAGLLDLRTDNKKLLALSCN